MTTTRTLAGPVLAGLLPLSAAAQGVIELDEVVLLPTATVAEAGRTGASVTVIDREELEETGDLRIVDYLERLPGVTATSNGGTGTLTNVYIRGADNRYIPIYVDGILVNDPTAPSGQYDDLGGLTTGGIERIEILKGSQSALYGSAAVGGVIAIQTTAGRDLGEGTHGRIAIEGGSYGSRATTASLTHNAGPLSLSVVASHAEAEGFSAADENDGFTEADGFRRSRLSFGAEYEVSSELTVGMTAFIEEGRTEYDDFALVDPETYTYALTDTDKISQRDAEGQRIFALWETGSVSHDTAFSRYAVTRTEQPSGDVFEGERLQFTHVSTVPVSPALDLSFGLDWREESARYDTLSDGDRSRRTLGGFVEAAYAISPDADLLATLRFDDDSQFGDFVSGRIAAAWRASDQLTLRGAVSRGYRAPSFDELYGDYPAFGFVGNPDLEPEESWSAEFGGDYRFSNGGQVSATVFRVETDNLLTYTSDFSTLENVNGATVRTGLEIGVEAPLTESVTVFGSATLMSTERPDGSELEGIPNQEYVVGATVDLSDAVSVTGSIRHVGDYEKYSASNDAYTVARMTATAAVTETTDVYLRVENLFDEEYQVAPGYGTSDRAFYVGLQARF